MQQELEAQGGRPPLLLHEELVALSAPTQAWSHRDGTMRGPADGLFHGEWRWIRGLELLVDGQPVEHLATAEERGWTVLRGVARGLDGDATAPRVLVERMRGVEPGELVERVTIVNGRDVEITATIELRIELELAPIASVRAGRPAAMPIEVRIQDGAAVATDGHRTLRCSTTRGAIDIDGHRVIASRSVVVPPGDWATLALDVEIDDPQLAAHSPLTASFPELRTTGRPALDRWAVRAVADLEALSLDVGHGPFPAAAAPWQMSLLAREALVAARLTLPLGAAIAEGTLRTLATRQGVLHDPVTGEEPGRIPHELRQDGEAPAAFFHASIDATPLWIVLLHDTWVAGMPTETARELRMALHAALGWLAEHTGDGFLVDPDAGDVSAAVQATACRAAVGAADLLDALGDDGDEWRAWAARLRTRFRAAFWSGEGASRQPGTALDRHGAPLDRIGADLAHLLGTRILDEEEEALVVELLLDERIASGFGLRSLAADDACYWPMLDRGGAIHPHETAVAIEGLLRAGYEDEARSLAEQLLAAAEAFDGRLPAAYAGYGIEDVAAPIPLPGACSPHAASAASAVVAHRALDIRPRSAHVERAERHLAAVEPIGVREPVRIVKAAISGTSATMPRQRAQLRLVEPVDE
ncbi:glycogen debranching N-terminal domain-containing protein [Agrococcus sp. DT81.2]|uniref:glycogen debranching N-terminal domain-containing protein n=1 Tax=Agrococcus sp. DT81.2 TaxID=3393414 RepID=UPI003CE519F4